MSGASGQQGIQTTDWLVPPEARDQFWRRDSALPCLILRLCSSARVDTVIPTLSVSSPRFRTPRHSTRMRINCSNSGRPGYYGRPLRLKEAAKVMSAIRRRHSPSQNDGPARHRLIPYAIAPSLRQRAGGGLQRAARCRPLAPTARTSAAGTKRRFEELVTQMLLYSAGILNPALMDLRRHGLPAQRRTAVRGLPGGDIARPSKDLRA